MSPDAELILIFTALHVVGLVLIGFLLVLFIRSDTVSPWTPPDDGGGGGGEGPGGGGPPPRGPGRDGLPLPDAAQASVRRRGPARFGDLAPARERRPAREPAPRPRVPDKR